MRGRCTCTTLVRELALEKPRCQRPNRNVAGSRYPWHVLVFKHIVCNEHLMSLEREQIKCPPWASGCDNDGLSRRQKANGGRCSRQARNPFGDDDKGSVAGGKIRLGLVSSAGAHQEPSAASSRSIVGDGGGVERTREGGGGRGRG